MSTELRLNAASWLRAWSVTLSLSMMLVSGGSLAQENKDLHTLSPEELHESIAPCAQWVFRARQMAPVGKAEGEEWIERRKQYVRASFPESSAGFILNMEALEAISGKIPEKEVQRRVMEKCRELKPRYVRKEGISDPGANKERDN